MSTRWQNSAACRDAEPETFYPAGDSYPQWAVDEAKKWCNPCPVRDECLEAHLDEIHGIFAATTPDDRKVIKKRRTPKSLRTDGCPDPGRARTVERHLAHGQPLCRPCAEFDADRTRTAELDQRVLTLAGQGRTTSAIARDLDLHRDVVAGIVRKYRKREVRREVAA